MGGERSVRHSAPISESMSWHHKLHPEGRGSKILKILVPYHNTTQCHNSEDINLNYDNK